MEENQNLSIRNGRASDAPVLAELAGELGYPSTADEMKSRLEAVSSKPDHAVFVADKKEIVGWIHISLRQSLETEPYAEISGLVVAETERGSGIGSRLVAEAERWAKEKGYRRVRVRTNVLRLDADAFYKRRGYVRKKTQDVFDKPL